MFGDNLIQNPPNSPDLAYPIETLWALLKKNVKKRMPQNLEELQKFTIEEEQNSRGLSKKANQKLFEKNTKSYRNKGQ